MKKIVIGIFSIAVIIAIVYGVLQQQKAESGIAQILPQDALIYVQINDAHRNLQKISTMPFWQAIQNINLNALRANEAIDNRSLVIFDMLQTQFKTLLDEPVAKRLFGKDVALGIYMPELRPDEFSQDIKRINPKLVEKLLSGIVIVTRVDADVQFAEFVSRFFGKFGANITQSQTEYKGQLIRLVTLQDVGMSFGVVRFKDILVVGVGDLAVQKSIDVFNGEQPALALNPQFSKLRSMALNPSHMFGYIDLDSGLNMINGQVQNLMNASGVKMEETDVHQQWEETLSQLRGLMAVGFSSQLEPKIRFDNYLIFDPTQLNPEFASMYTCPPGDNRTIRFVPKEVIGYQWSNCLDLNHYWKQMKKEITSLDASGAAVNDLETRLGMNIERDLLPAFGSEFGGYLEDIQVGGFIPIPQLLLFVEVGNRSKADQLLAKLKEQPVTMLQQEQYQGHMIEYLALPLGENVQPAYSFFENYFIASTSRQMIKNVIDISKDVDLSLTANPGFQSVNIGLTDKNRYVQFFKLGEVIAKIKGLLDWSNQWMVAQERKAEAFKAGSQRPVDEVEASISTKGSELEAIREELDVLEDEIWNEETKGGDVASLKEQKVQLEGRLDAKKQEIIAEEERLVELTEIVEDYDDKKLDPKARKAILDEIVYPVLEALRSIVSVGIRSTVEQDIFKTSVIMEIR